MVEIDPAILATLIGAIVALAFAMGGWAFRHNHVHGKLENQIKNLEDNFQKDHEAVEFAKSLQTLTKNPGIINMAKSIGPEPPKRNPYDLKRKYELLLHYQNGSIGLDEAKELEEILQEDLRHAEATGSTAIAAILLLLAAITALIGVLTSEKR